MASCRGFCGRPCHQVGPGQKRLVLTFDRVDGRRPPPSLRIVEDVVVNQRADLNQLDGHSRCDNPGIERLSNVGNRQGQGRTKSLSASSHHSKARIREGWCTDRAGDGEAGCSRCPDVPQVPMIPEGRAVTAACMDATAAATGAPLLCRRVEVAKTKIDDGKSRPYRLASRVMSLRSRSRGAYPLWCSSCNSALRHGTEVSRICPIANPWGGYGQSDPSGDAPTCHAVPSSAKVTGCRSTSSPSGDRRITRTGERSSATENLKEERHRYTSGSALEFDDEIDIVVRSSDLSEQSVDTPPAIDPDPQVPCLEFRHDPQDLSRLHFILLSHRSGRVPQFAGTARYPTDTLASWKRRCGMRLLCSCRNYDARQDFDQSSRTGGG